MGSFDVQEGVCLVAPCLLLMVRKENPVVISDDGCLPTNSEGRDDRYCCRMAASSSFSSSTGRLGAIV